MLQLDEVSMSGSSSWDLARVHHVAVQRELADERIDLPQAQGQLRMALQIAAHEAVVAHADFQRGGAGVVGGSRAIFFGQRQHAQDAAHGQLSLQTMHGLAQRADVGPGFFGAVQ